MEVHVNGKQLLDRVFERQSISLDSNYINVLYSFFAQMYVYEIEERKQNPQIIIGTGLERLLSTPIVFKVLYEFSNNGEFASNSLLKNLKTLVPFCNNGWFIVLNVITNSLQLGIAKYVVQPPGDSFEKKFLEYPADETIGALIITPITKYELKIVELNKEKNSSNCISYISRRFKYSQDQKDQSIEIEKIVEVMLPSVVKKYKHLENELKPSIKGIFERVINQCHGAILVIIEQQSTSALKKNPFFANNQITTLSSSMNIITPLTDWLLGTRNEDYSHSYVSQLETMFKVYSDLFTQMLDVDGFTLIDTSGSILSFNCFVSETNDVKCAGGARRRAYESIKKQAENKKTRIKAALFLSQDGDMECSVF